NHSRRVGLNSATIPQRGSNQRRRRSSARVLSCHWRPKNVPLVVVPAARLDPRRRGRRVPRRRHRGQFRGREHRVRPEEGQERQEGEGEEGQGEEGQEEGRQDVRRGYLTSLPAHKPSAGGPPPLSPYPPRTVRAPRRTVELAEANSSRARCRPCCPSKGA